METHLPYLLSLWYETVAQRDSTDFSVSFEIMVTLMKSMFLDFAIFFFFEQQLISFLLSFPLLFLLPLLRSYGYGG